MSEATPSTEQLALELTPGRVVVPLQFRVSEATSRRGLAHIAELRQVLARRQADRDAAVAASHAVAAPRRAA